MTTPNDLPSVGTALPEEINASINTFGNVCMFSPSSVAVNSSAPLREAIRNYAATLISERDELAARVRELEGERDAAVNCLTWLKAHLSRFDPPASPNYLVGEIDTALTASKGQP